MNATMSWQACGLDTGQTTWKMPGTLLLEQEVHLVETAGLFYVL